MRKCLLLVLLGVVHFFGAMVFAQSDGGTSVKKAEKLYLSAKESLHNRNYEVAFEGFRAAIKKDPEYADAYMALAFGYKEYNLYNLYTDKILKNFLKVDELQPHNEKYVRVYFELAKISVDSGDYESASTYIDKVLEFPEANKRVTINAKELKKLCDFALEAKEYHYELNLEVLPRETVNCFQYNSSPSLTADGNTLYYSVRNHSTQYDEDIYFSERIDGEWTKSESISDKINTKGNDGLPNISGDGKTLVFTKCSYKLGNKTCDYDLYISHKEGEEWSEPVNLGDKVNSSAKEGSPSLSVDGKTLYFYSHRDGGYGNADLYVSHLNVDNEWSEPMNLGPTVNSAGSEVTPFIHADGRHLYFASTGHQGFGGYDLFYTVKSDTGWTVPKNMGSPINTPQNEGSLVILPDYSLGYYEIYELQSGVSYSNIYTFEIPEIFVPKFVSHFLVGKVYNEETGEHVNAEITVALLSDTVQKQITHSDSISGSYLTSLTEGGEYALYVKAKGYMFKSVFFDYKSDSSYQDVKLDIHLSPIKPNSSAVLANLFYETDSYVLSEESKYELNNLVSFLRINSSAKIQIGGFTDNQGKEDYNVALSTDRAKAVFDYLLSAGIEADRVTYKGFGAKYFVADNATEEGRAKNRRIEVKVLSLD